MLEAALVAAAMALVYLQLNAYSGKPAAAPAAATIVTGNPATTQLNQLVEYAERLLREKKYLSAEKAYLRILKLDHKNAAAYSQLGYIYTSLKNYPDAIECLQIAAQLAPSGSNYQNLGQVFFENRNYIRSIAAYEKSIMFEPTARRYLSLARAHHMIANKTKALAELEQAVELDPSVKYLQPLAEAYAVAHDRVKMESTYRRILEIEPDNAKALQIVGSSPKRLETKP